MKFWDSSALVPLCLNSSQTERCLDLLEKDRRFLVWQLSLCEVWSALCRIHRAGEMSDAVFLESKRRIQELSKSWIEVVVTESVCRRSLRLLEIHSLKSADALQLSAAMAACQEQTLSFGFVCFDQKLTIAARKEGFDVFAAT